MPKGEIVGIKLVLPSVTTHSYITNSTELRAMQYLPGNTVSTGLCSVYRAMQCLPGYADSTGFCSGHRVQYRMQWSPSIVQNAVVTEYSTECSGHRVQYRMQCSPSHQSGTVFTEEQCLLSDLPLPSLQWLPSSELLKVVSMNRVFTSTECMTMPGNLVDTVYQRITESVQ